MTILLAQQMVWRGQRKGAGREVCLYLYRLICRFDRPRFVAVVGGRVVAFDADGNPQNAPAPAGQDPGGDEIHLELTNRGYHLERVQQIHYHIKGEGWRRVPDSAGGWRPRRPGDEGDPNIPVVGFTKTYTPFDVDPQHAKKWEYRVASDRGNSLLSTISCVRVVTTKENIHARLQDSGRLAWLLSLCCSLGSHR